MTTVTHQTRRAKLTLTAVPDMPHRQPWDFQEAGVPTTLKVTDEIFLMRVITGKIEPRPGSTISCKVATTFWEHPRGSRTYRAVREVYHLTGPEKTTLNS